MTIACSLVTASRRARVGVSGTRIGQVKRSLSYMVRLNLRGPRHLSLPKKDVSGNKWEDSEVNFLIGLLKNLKKIAEFPEPLIAKFVFLN